MSIEITEQDFYNMRNQRDAARAETIKAEIELATLRAEIVRLSKSEATLQTEISRLTKLVDELSEDATQNGIAFRNMLYANKQQAAQIEAMTAALEDMKILVNNPSAWEHYDDEVSAKIKNLLVIARLVKDGEVTK